MECVPELPECFGEITLTHVTNTKRVFLMTKDNELWH